MEKFWTDKGACEKATSEKKEETLTAMEFTLRMDREADREKHYISPGGYILNNKEFDFAHSEGEIDKKDRSKVHFLVMDFDLDVFGKVIYPKDTKGEFSEFYVYTGEADEPEIHAQAVEELIFYFGDKAIPCPKKTLMSANRCLEKAA